MNWRLQIKRKGFSLAEAMMATVVLGIAAAGVLLPFTAGAAARAEGGRRMLASRLGADLVEQIIRTDFDQMITDYDGYVEVQGEVKDAGGVEFTDSRYANFSRTAICEYVYMPEESGAASPRFILVTVSVYYSGKEIATVNRLVGR